MVPRQNVAKLIVAAASLGLLFVVLVLFWGREEKFRMTNLEWGVYFFRMTNSVRIF